MNAGDNFDRLNRLIGRVRPMTDTGSTSSGAQDPPPEEPQADPFAEAFGSRQSAAQSGQSQARPYGTTPEPPHDPYAEKSFGGVQSTPRPYGSSDDEAFAATHADQRDKPYENAYEDAYPESHQDSRTPRRNDPYKDHYGEAYEEQQPNYEPDPYYDHFAADPEAAYEQEYGSHADASWSTEPDDYPVYYRLLSLDTFRGLIMCALALNGLALAATAKRLGYGFDVETDSIIGHIWQWLAFHNSHSIWNSQFYVVGCSFWDLIQPAFIFMVGVAMPFSYTQRRARGDTSSQLTAHAAYRAAMLVGLGVFLQTHYTGLDSNRLFTNVLAQIGLGYFFVYMLLGQGPRTQLTVAAVVLAGYWAWFVSYSVPDPMPWAAAESIKDLTMPRRFAEQFAFNVNPAAEFDMKLFAWLPPNGIQHGPHPAGYATLNFVPSAVTMLFGVLTGNLLISRRPEYAKVRLMATSGTICMVLAIALSVTVCPVVKKIWTPSWTLYSGAWMLWAMAGLYWLVDVKGYRNWTWPIVIVGMNSLAMYLMTMLIRGWVSDRWRVYASEQVFAGGYAPTIEAIAVFAVLWLICLYLYRAKIFLRV